MPRNDGNSSDSPTRHHKKMKSGHKGKGLDKKLKLAKQIAGQSSHSAKPEKKRKKPARLEYEPAA